MNTIITQGSGQTVINSFVGVGTSNFTPNAVGAMIDTLKFVGADLTANNFQIVQQGNDTLITFLGVDAANTSVLLKNFDYQTFDNQLYSTAPVAVNGVLGNAIFDGQDVVTNNIDVQNRYGNLAQVWNLDTVTFLNGGANVTNGREASNDVINAMGGNDVIRGLSGNDILRGQFGDDKLYGDQGNDIVDGGAGRDQLFGGSGNDTLIGGDDNDVLTGDSGNDTMFGGNGDDKFIGGTGADIMDGGMGLGDVIDYTSSNAGVTLNFGGTETWAGAGGYAEGDLLTSINNFTGSKFDDVIVAQGTFGGKDNSINGLAGNDILKGGSGFDRIDGGAGNDVIEGGKDADVLIGGAGADVFVFNAADWGVNTIKDMSHDAITDFSTADDVIRMVGFGTPADFGAWFDAHVIADVWGVAHIVDDNYNVAGSYGSQIELAEVLKSSLTAANFDFV